MKTCLAAESARLTTENGKTYWSNPSQKDTKECLDVAPDDRYTCVQQVSMNIFAVSDSYTVR